MVSIVKRFRLFAWAKPLFGEEEIKLDTRTRIFINPWGVLLGGPARHSGLTGRKNSIDTYGEYTRHSAKEKSDDVK
ncbi:MAG: methionine adenosyltransferase domain-containing protein [Deltaproteobacteria bacterium]|nr:methionine adenosyltransferase domain-containing protein [Deltaproteobacteria bacterium]